MAWSQVRETVAEALSASDGLILFCGMSIGYEDPTVSYARTGRAPLDETVTFVGGQLSLDMARQWTISPTALSGRTIFLSLVSTTKMARSLAGSVLLAF